MEVAKGKETREKSKRTRSRGLLAGRLAVKIEICTDSSMRGGGRVWRCRRGWAWKCLGPKIGEPNLPRIAFDEHPLLVFSVRPRSSFSLPVYPVSYSRFVLPSIYLRFSLFLLLFSIFARRYKMSYSYEVHIAREGETRSVFTEPSFVFVIFSLLVNHASFRYAFIIIIL